jgi:broad specificity phosphatase PhoE
MDKTIIFFRHAVPNANNIDLKKGIKFLGRRDNPSIILPKKNKISSIKKELQSFDFFISSPMKRCKESISLLTNKKIIETPLILEIDYGYADGLYLKEIQEKYNYLFDAWKRGEDPRFPNGENNLDVIKRIKLFINELIKLKEYKIAVCTHNVFLRCLIGSSLKIPVKDWYKIQIPYFEPIKFTLKENKLEYIGNLAQKSKLLKNINLISFDSYFIALVPEEKIYSKILSIKKDVFQRFGDQKYLRDPPHCTLYVSLAENLEEVRKKIEEISLKEKKIDAIISSDYVEFTNDKFAGGGTSLGLRFDKKANKRIISIQEKVVNVLNELRKGEIHTRYKDKILSEQLTKNIEKYGFPFVGNIFIPHINFCCFNLSKDIEKFKQLYPIEKFSGQMRFTKLALYRLYSNDKTELIKEFELQ